MFHQWPYTLVRLPCYYWAVITSGGDHGHMIYTLYCYITYDTVRRWGLKGQVAPSRQRWAWVPDGPRLLLCGGATGQVETA